jgi:hypothetical protein
VRRRFSLYFQLSANDSSREEKMIISDLNYLETVAQEVSIVGGFRSRFVRENLAFSERVYIRKDIAGSANVRGRIAFAQADSVGFGSNVLTNAISYTEVGPNYSISSATSAAAAN